jgi:HJR/Mrr/RecB family endonuclease
MNTLLSRFSVEQLKELNDAISKKNFAQFEQLVKYFSNKPARVNDSFQGRTITPLGQALTEHEIGMEEVI